MGFMDKAKKMAEQAQAKLDEAQKNFNEKQGSGGGGESGGGPAVEYDAHGRPINAPASAEAPPAPQPTAPPTSSADGGPTPDPGATAASPAAEPTQPHGDPLLDDEPGSRHGADAEREARGPGGGAPGMTSGDPLG